MPKLIMMCGAPGSGKSTYAKTLEDLAYIRINQDDQGKDHLIQFAAAIANRRDIVIDRMSFNKKQRSRYLDPAKAAGYETEIVVFHVPKAVCQERCRQRKDHPTVKTEEDIQNATGFFFKSYERPTSDEADAIFWKYHYEVPFPRPKTIIVDIDGTIANIEHRRHFVDKSKGKTNWKSFFDEMVNDTPHKWCVDLITKMSTDHTIVFCSGRGDNYREHTETWLNKYLPNVKYELYMRPRDDYRKDNLIKEIILDFELIPRYDIQFVIDDRTQVVEMWRDRQLVCLQCYEGDF